MYTVVFVHFLSLSNIQCKFGHQYLPPRTLRLIYQIPPVTCRWVIQNTQQALVSGTYHLSPHGSIVRVKTATNCTGWIYFLFTIWPTIAQLYQIE